MRRVYSRAMAGDDFGITEGLDGAGEKLIGDDLTRLIGRRPDRHARCATPVPLMATKRHPANR